MNMYNTVLQVLKIMKPPIKDGFIYWLRLEMIVES